VPQLLDLMEGGRSELSERVGGERAVRACYRESMVLGSSEHGLGLCSGLLLCVVVVGRANAISVNSSHAGAFRSDKYVDAAEMIL